MRFLFEPLSRSRSDKYVVLTIKRSKRLAKGRVWIANKESVIDYLAKIVYHRIGAVN